MSTINFQMFSDYETMCKRTADEIAENLMENPEQLLCIAAGHTSLGVFRELIRKYQNQEIDFSKASFVAMDEWLYMDAETEGSCGWFLVEEFLKKVNYPKERIFLWNGNAENYVQECELALKFIKNNSRDSVIDYLVLGAGMNGHLALNEPGTELESRAHVTQLDELTAKVGQKYFKETAVLNGGITLGLADFKDAKRSVLLINGAEKKGILKKIREVEGFQKTIPATAMYTFENSSIYCAKDAIE